MRPTTEIKTQHTMQTHRHLLILLLLNHYSHQQQLDFPPSRRELYRQRVLSMFYHAYDSYLEHAYPHDELLPLSCSGRDTWSGRHMPLQLVDALDTLVVVGNHSEFRRVASLLLMQGGRSGRFDVDVNVSVFETNIRVIGGLLAAHLLSDRAGFDDARPPSWPCSGAFLELAEELAARLVPAFRTNTSMPYGTVNLRYGVPRGETSITCTASIGTFLLEFGFLSRLTGVDVYERVAMDALRALWQRRSRIDLVGGNHIDVESGVWTSVDTGIGSYIDSYLEYLVKGAAAFDRPELIAMFDHYRAAIDEYVRTEDDWHFAVHAQRGSELATKACESLEAFWPGVLVLTGDVDAAKPVLLNYVDQVTRRIGFMPEQFSVRDRLTIKGRDAYPLRPELVESLYALYRATRDPLILHHAAAFVDALDRSSRTRCGFAGLRVEEHAQEDRMESFLIAEVFKYLYLLFDDENFVHANDDGTPHRGATDECVTGASGAYLFNTEAHLLDMGALECCSRSGESASQWLERWAEQGDDQWSRRRRPDPDSEMKPRPSSRRKAVTADSKLADEGQVNLDWDEPACEARDSWRIVFGVHHWQEEDLCVSDAIRRYRLARWRAELFAGGTSFNRSLDEALPGVDRFDLLSCDSWRSWRFAFLANVK